MNMINHGIVRFLIGKTEADAIAALVSFNCKWRVYAIDGSVTEAPNDRDDGRYGLIINNGLVTRVIAG
jgi:hypothetical protein